MSGGSVRENPSRTAVLVAVGGAIWALTPLRSPIFGAGSEPDEGVLIFRGYNLLVIVVVSLMTLGVLALRKQRHAGSSRAFAAGWWTVLAGHVLLLAGSLPAVLFGGHQRDIVMNAQDVGFLGAAVAAVGALPLGISALRQDYVPRLAALLFIATLPLGVLGILLLDGLGVPEDYLGLPLTLSYGGAWVALGHGWARGDRPGAHRDGSGTRGRGSANVDAPQRHS